MPNAMPKIIFCCLWKKSSWLWFSQISLGHDDNVVAIKLTLVAPTQTPGTASSFVSDWSEDRISVLLLVDIRVAGISLAIVTPPSPSFLTLTSRVELSIGTKRAVSRREIKSHADPLKSQWKDLNLQLLLYKIDI